MKRAAITIAAIAAFAISTYGQGSLTPPGAPAETMKTLEQVEPRTPIHSSGYEITESGSYYLTTNLTASGSVQAINIIADNVSLDLNGFAILGAAGTASGITVKSGSENVRVENGTVRDCYHYGINAEDAAACTFRNLWIIGNARYSSGYEGLRCGTGAVVENCRFEDNGGAGLVCLADCFIVHCRSIGNGTGISGGDRSRVADCEVSGNTFVGIAVGSTGVVERCTVINNGNNGIEAGHNSTVEQCTVRGDSGHGIATSGSRVRVTGCDIQDCSAAGIFSVAGSTGNVIRANTLIGNGKGLWIMDSGNRVAGNCVKSKGDNYDIVADNELSLILCELPEILEWPCYAELTAPLTCSLKGVDGITVTADDVTIDLGGHYLTGPGKDSGNGMFQTEGGQRLSVRNGSVTGWEGSDKGGINTRSGGSSRIRNITASENHHGIRLGSRGRVIDCLAHGNEGYGISVSSDGTVSDCLAYANMLGGISAGDDCLIEGNQCQNNGNGTGYGGGIHVHGKHTRVVNNKCNVNARGFSILNTSNFIVQNHAGGNGIDYYIIVSNKVGVIEVPPFTTHLIDNFGTIGHAHGVGTTDPWANFLY